MPLHLLGISRTKDVARLACVRAGALGTARVDGPMVELAGRHTSHACWVVHGDLTAATVPPLEPRAGPGRHADLLEAIHRRMDVLPMRFGAVLPDERAVKEFLDKRRTDLRADLDRLEGTVEMGLRIELPGEDQKESPAPSPTGPAPSPSPVEYLAQRRRKYDDKDHFDHQADSILQRYLGELEGVYRQWRRLGPPRPRLVRAAFLLERTAVTAFQTRLNAIQADRKGSQCTVVGPWPPYSFV